MKKLLFIALGFISFFMRHFHKEPAWNVSHKQSIYINIFCIFVYVSGSLDHLIKTVNVASISSGYPERPSILCVHVRIVVPLEYPYTTVIRCDICLSFWPCMWVSDGRSAAAHLYSRCEQLGVNLCVQFDQATIMQLLVVSTSFPRHCRGPSIALPTRNPLLLLVEANDHRPQTVSVLFQNEPLTRHARVEGLHRGSVAYLVRCHSTACEA